MFNVVKLQMCCYVNETKKFKHILNRKAKTEKMSLFIGRQFKPSALNLSRPVLSELKDLDQNSN